jgi:Hg(II)-responsive transcriptional regulator
MFAPMAGLLIGDVATRARVKVSTVRYYERRGLLTVPPRRESGYREYPPEAVDRVRFIRRAQEMGFTLHDIADLLELQTAPGHRSDVRDRATERLAEVREQIATLLRIERALGELVQRCSGDGPIATCPILHAIEKQ